MGRLAASFNSSARDGARTSAEPEGKKPASRSEMTNPSGVECMVMLSSGSFGEVVLSRRSF